MLKVLPRRMELAGKRVAGIGAAALDEYRQIQIDIICSSEDVFHSGGGGSPPRLSCYANHTNKQINLIKYEDHNP